MKCCLSLQERLKDLRIEKNLTLEELSELTGISKSALGSYENDDYKEMNHSSLVTLAKFYNVSTDYLLCLTENRKHNNTELAELHISDDMIDFLRSELINNRLLCEIATNDKFPKLMADAEIYVDGIATGRFCYLNDSLEDVRLQILSENPNITPDHIFRTLEAAHINEEDFFCHITHKTWDSILKDIRKAHEKDIESLSDEELYDTKALFRKVFHSVKNGGDPVFHFIMGLCHAFKLDYQKIPANELATLKKLFRKSSVIKNSGIKFRKRKK